MKEIIFVFSIMLFLLFSCKNQVELTIDLSEINSLTSIEKQQKFLEEIHDIDQGIRIKESELIQSMGYESDEYQAHFRKMIKTDDLHLYKIEKYLELYGHPSIDKHSAKATGAPSLVVHHSGEGIKSRRRNFHYFYKAYTDGDISDTAMTFYLNRMYLIKFGKMISWNKPYRIEDELDTLYKSLDLVKIIQELEN